MNKREVFAHYSQIIDELLTSPFFKTYFQRPYVINYDIPIEHEVDLKTGATRGCLIDSKYDYVVKYDILDGYSETEVELYEKARASHLDKFFCEAQYIGTYLKTIQFYDIENIEDYYEWYDDIDESEFNKDFIEIEDKLTSCPIVIEIPLYAYARANSLSFNYSDKSERLAKYTSGPLRSRNLAIAAKFIDDFTLEDYNILNDFLIYNNINDIHLGNVGCIDNHICLIDYAGFHGGSYDTTSFNVS